MRSSTQRGFTLIELLVVIAIIAILASILFPVFSKAREQARKAQCISNVRQIAQAIQMYVQDNGSQYPGNDASSWVSKIASYLGNSDKMFQCPSDTVKDSGAVSYAFAGVLTRKDGSGVKESNVLSPSEVGCVVDATPSETYPTGRLVGGGGMLAEADNAALPATRHSKGAVAGFCDGHAKYYQGSINDKDMSNGITLVFFQVSSLGLIDNPLGCIGSGSAISGSYGTVTVGGEANTAPLLMAAAQMYGNYYTRGFVGASYTTGRGTNYAWGQNNVSGATAIARDAFVFIVAKGCKIPLIGAMSNSTYIRNTTQILDIFNDGYIANSVQAFHMSSYSDTDAYAKSVLGISTWAQESLEVANDLEMVEKVSNDPYAIGFCSSVYADPDRVVVIAPSATEVWPRASTKYRWVMPVYADSNWPWKRAINVSASGTGGLAFEAALMGGGLMTALENGPLFKAGYWPAL